MFDHYQTETHSKARLGRLKTKRGYIDTPVFMPVGTQASVKALDLRELNEIGTEILLGNTYHLFLRPGLDIIHKAGGLHKFMNWHKPILTDSGGFQVYSLAKIRSVSDEGVEFRSHLSGEKLFLGRGQNLKITSVGEIGLEELNVSFKQIERTVNRMKSYKNKNRLVITCEPSFASAWLVPRLNKSF